MFHQQIQRVKYNILPFMLIGFCIGIVIGKASWFRSINWLDNYLRYAQINTYHHDSGQTLFFKYFDPNVLTFLLFALFFFAGMNRLLFGSHEGSSKNVGSISHSIETFGSLLAIAWLGLTVGIALPVLLFQGVNSSIGLLVHTVYPIFFLIEVSICTTFLSGNALGIFQNIFGGSLGSNLGARIGGLLVLGIALTILTYETKYAAAVKSCIAWLKSLAW
jgi:hypothetical protein